MAKRKIDISEEPEEGLKKIIEVVANGKEAKCKRCGEVKPLDQFWKSRKQKSGHSVWCRLCLGEGRDKPEEQGS